jgi:hypothetical protein
MNSAVVEGRSVIPRGAFLGGFCWLLPQMPLPLVAFALLFAPFSMVPTVRRVTLTGDRLSCELGEGRFLGVRRGLGNGVSGRVDLEFFVAWAGGAPSVVRVQDAPVASRAVGLPSAMVDDGRAAPRGAFFRGRFFRAVSFAPALLFLVLLAGSEASRGHAPVGALVYGGGWLLLRVALLAVYRVAAATPPGQGLRWWLRF